MSTPVDAVLVARRSADVYEKNNKILNKYWIINHNFKSVMNSMLRTLRRSNFIKLKFWFAFW